MKKFLLSLIIAMNFVGIHAKAIKHDNIVIPPTMEITNDSLFNKTSYPIYRYLNLDDTQQLMFQKIHLDLYRNMRYLDDNRNDEAKEKFNKNLNKDLKRCGRVLSESQYLKYMRVLNITLSKEGLIQYTFE